MCDVYLGGISDDVWRRTFKEEVSQDISMFDPMVENYENYDEFEKANQTARELLNI